MVIRAVVFDFRDTLLDVTEGYLEANRFLEKWLKERGVRLIGDERQRAAEQVKRTYGKRTDVHDWTMPILVQVVADVGLTVQSAEMRLLADGYNSCFASGVRLFPDGIEILEWLRQRQIRCAAVIDGTVKREREIIQRLGLRLDVTVISEEVGENKFSPVPLERAVELLGLRPQYVLVVGDRVDKDIVHANRLGCVSVLLKREGGRYRNMETENVKPDVVIKNLLELQPLIENLS